jgi:hypothetical protein
MVIQHKSVRCEMAVIYRIRSTFSFVLTDVGSVGKSVGNSVVGIWYSVELQKCKIIRERGAEIERSNQYSNACNYSQELEW